MFDQTIEHYIYQTLNQPNQQDTSVSILITLASLSPFFSSCKHFRMFSSTYNLFLVVIFYVFNEGNPQSLLNMHIN